MAKAQDKAHAEEAHVSTSKYLRIAGILAVITAIEFAIVYVEALKSVVVPILFVLSAVKFGMVAAYFMHLKFEKKMLTWFFVIGIALAAAITLALVFVMKA